MRKIICNNEICHAITETGLVFSWGNDIYHNGTLGLGDNIYQVNTPVINKYLSKNLIFDISLSEEHCAAIDFNNCLYTWGLNTHGELGFYDKKEKIVSTPNKIMHNNKPFIVEKIKCGKHYTTGITNDGIPFLFGNKDINNNDKDNNIIFFSFDKNYNYYNIIAKDIFCSEYFIVILLENDKLLLYSFNEGLFELIINNNSYNNHITISKVNIIDKNIYVLDEKNKTLYEFIYQSKNHKDSFNIKDFILNEYEINNDIKLSIIEMPFFVKFLFFWIECSENQKKNFISQKNKMFLKKSDNKDINNCFKHNKIKSPYINECILFGNNKKKFEIKKIEYENNYQRKNIYFFTKENTMTYDKYKKIFDLNEESLNLPISKNYGNKNDIIDKKNINENSNIKNNTIEFNKVINKTMSFNNNKKRYSNSLDKNRSKRTIDDHIDNNITESIEHKSTINNESNKYMKNSNSFLVHNKSLLEKTENKYNYIHFPINKIRNNSNIKENKINSRTINYEKENEFDNILRNINNRQLMTNHPLNLEEQVPSTKKILSKIGRKKSKTEMLIKELHEAFFGKENKSKNIFSNYQNNNLIKDNKKNKNEKKIFKFNRNSDKREIKLKESKSINNIYDYNKELNDYNDYNKKKEIEIDINKILVKSNNNKNDIKLIKIENEKNEDNSFSEKEKMNLKLKLEKEKLEKEIKEIKAQKEEEYILKEKLEKQCIEIEQNIKNKKNEEKKDNLSQKKNLVITNEINKFIEGKNNNIENTQQNLINNNNNKIFIPEKLKTENENEFVMKGINHKQNYKLEISNIQQINIENNINNKKNNNELNLNIEDITSTRDILFDNKDLINQQSIIISDLIQKNNNNELEENKDSSSENNSAKKKSTNLNRKDKSKNKKRINEIIEENQELESLEDTSKSKNKTKAICCQQNNNNINNLNNINKTNTEKSLIQIADISTSNMKHISTYDQNIISSIRKFEPKELDDITGSLRFFSNRSENIIISSLANKNINKPASQRTNNNNINMNINNSTNKKPYVDIREKNKNIYDLNNLKLNLNYENNKDINTLIINNEHIIKDQKMKIDDLEQSKLLSGKNENNNKLDINSNISEVKNKLFEPNKLIKLKNREELSNIMTEIKKEESSNDSLYFLLEDNLQISNLETNNKKDLQILKVKNNEIIELNSGNNLILNDDNNKSKIFFNKLKYLRNYNSINKEPYHNYHTFSEKQNLIENNSSIYKSPNQRMQTNFEESKNIKNNNIIRGIQIKKMNRNKSHNKQSNHKQKKKLGIIEQIKKEQYEKRQQIIYNTFNNKNKIILTNNNVNPYINLKQKKLSKNSVANIGYNNMFHYDQGMIPININMNMNILHDENNKINNSAKNTINNNKEKNNESFIILRKKYLDFLIKIYGNENIPLNNEKIDNTFLEGLINNEVPIENINLNLLKCSNDMKNFIGESLENFKLQQIKEKMNKINDGNLLYLHTNNNEKMQLEYDDDIKDKSNILEPIELDKSNNYNLNFRKSFIESLSGIKNENKLLKSDNNK